MIKLKKPKLSLYQKYAVVVILAAIVPIVLLVSTFLDSLIDRYQEAMLHQYQSAADYVASDITSLIDSYNTISKIPYYYNFSSDESASNNRYSFDSFRKVVFGEIYDPDSMEILRQQDMSQFLKYLQSVNADIVAAHFLMYDTDGSYKGFHFSSYASYIADEKKYLDHVSYDKWDKETNKLVIVPTHKADYYKGLDYDVITVGRNYFDLRGQVGNTAYVGTLYLDIKLSRFEKLFRNAAFEDNEKCYVLDRSGTCIYSSDKENIGVISDAITGQKGPQKDSIVIETEPDDYGLYTCVVMNSEKVYGSIVRFKRILYVALIISAGILIYASFVISKRMTKPIYDIMKQMEKVEAGDFEIALESSADDELGVLSERFNQMSRTLEKYINQSYVAKLKQSEAEMTALKSQIYPHFLYNTLEIIRMTALDENSERVAKMIEALSEQIRYIIGPLQDMVPLEKEIEIVRKYVYLINCRYQSKVQLGVERKDEGHFVVPKLILQPVVENAYVHGIRPKKESGTILIEVCTLDDKLEISVMDNGVGMEEEKVADIYRLFESEDPGIKDEHNWQSIGIKNVNDRIRYMYGEDYGLSITSTVNVGTNVTITLPMIRERELDA